MLFYLKETRINWSDNVSFSEKPTLSADDVGFFRESYFISERAVSSDQIMWVFHKNPLYLQRNLLYLRETHMIWSDNVRVLDTPTSSADNASFFQENLVYQPEKPTLCNYCDNGLP